MAAHTHQYIVRTHYSVLAHGRQSQEKRFRVSRASSRPESLSPSAQARRLARRPSIPSSSPGIARETRLRGGLLAAGPLPLTWPLPPRGSPRATVRARPSLRSKRRHGSLCSATCVICVELFGIVVYGVLRSVGLFKCVVLDYRHAQVCFMRDAKLGKQRFNQFEAIDPWIASPSLTESSGSPKVPAAGTRLRIFFVVGPPPGPLSEGPLSKGPISELFPGI